MDFTGADPSVVKSIRQRYLLNEWLRAAGKRQPMPLVRDFQLDRVDDEMADMMGYDVVGEGDGARFLITHQGARLATTYGNERIDPPNGRAFSTRKSGPSDMPTSSTLYRACLRHKRPAYSISTVQDADGKEVSYERLLMPFGEGEAVQQIIGSFKSISIRRRLPDQQPHGPEAESRARDSGQGDHRSHFRAGSSRPAFRRRNYRSRLASTSSAPQIPRGFEATAHAAGFTQPTTQKIYFEPTHYMIESRF
jgi:hypothetical protein